MCEPEGLPDVGIPVKLTGNIFCKENVKYELTNFNLFKSFGPDDNNSNFLKLLKSIAHVSHFVDSVA